MGHWQSIIESLNTILCTMKENFLSLMRESASQYWLVVKVGLVKQKAQSYICATLLTWEGELLLLKVELLSRKSWSPILFYQPLEMQRPLETIIQGRGFSLILVQCKIYTAKITLWQNIRHFCMLPRVPLYQVYFSPHLRNRPINQSFLQLVPGLSNNFKHYLKFLVPLSGTTFVVLNPIIFSSQQFLSTKMFCSNCAVEVSWRQSG